MNRTREIVEVKFRALPRNAGPKEKDLMKIADKWAENFLRAMEEAKEEEEAGQKSVHSSEFKVQGMLTTDNRLLTTE